MAVSKMQKWTILVEDEYRSLLLKTVQELQHFEPIDTNFVTKTVNDDEHQYEQLLTHIRHAQSVLGPFVPKKIKKTRFSLTLSELEQQMVDVDKRDILTQVLNIDEKEKLLQKQMWDNKDKHDLLKKWQSLPLLPKDMRKLTYLHTFVGVIPQTKTNDFLDTLLHHEHLFVDVLYRDTHDIGLIAYIDKTLVNEANDVLSSVQFEKFDYPFEQLPKDMLIETELLQEAINEKRYRLIAEKEALSQFYTDLLLLEEYTYTKYLCQKASAYFSTSQHISGLTGWISEEKSSILQSLIAKTLPQGAYVFLENTENVDEKEIPIVLKNHPLVEPFELLTEMYSVPKYSEIDPTPLLAPFYAVFFGMMVADIGYGLVMFLGTLYALIKLSLPKSTKKNIKLFHILSYPTMLWGLIFGSFFGLELPFHLLSASSDPITILIISVVFGVIQLIFGLLVNTRTQLKAKQYSAAFSDGLCWVGLLLGLVMYALSQTTSLTWLATIGQYTLLINAIGIVLSTALGTKNKILGIGSGVYKLYGASSYIGDLSSYTRLMALCAAGASIGSAFNLIISLLPVPARFTIGIVLFVLLHALNFGLSLLGAYVHGIRLQFVEFFGKFYEGGGRAIKPLKTYEKYNDLKERYSEEK
ncbi:hypothetical protein GMA11_04785 [Granulicatella sp. zg-ZJ]|uniref:V-type ATP synthase subunit I n=1 Tax=Granulicatella sp. zg-ZJ TaxID=2678504 RepID=UPI0013D768CB|nr:V-type ATP synthase subunit I [Granulicatella sp. zg-ZJ]NEW62705.1 hypothetical protein [Granulicatella sp. zg-ZJ]